MASAASAISVNDRVQAEFEAAAGFSYLEVAALPELQRPPVPTPAHIRVANNFLLALTRRRFAKRGGINGMTEGEYAAKYAKLLDRFAAIVGKTYEVQGDGFELSDDEAVARIVDVIKDIDPTAIERNKDKRLSRR